MINSIIQSIIENKDFLEESLENSIKDDEISMFSRDLRKVLDEAGRKTIVGILEAVDKILFENQRRKLEYETKDLIKRMIITEYGNIEYTRRYYSNKQTKEKCIFSRWEVRNKKWKNNKRSRKQNNRICTYIWRITKKGKNQYKAKKIW